MSSSIHEEDINDVLAEKYAELYQKGSRGKAAGIILAAEAIGDLGIVSGEIVKDQAERDYFCNHPNEAIRDGANKFFCSECDKSLNREEVLERLQKDE